jgi:hypothetical protein
MNEKTLPRSRYIGEGIEPEMRELPVCMCHKEYPKEPMVCGRCGGAIPTLKEAKELNAY